MIHIRRHSDGERGFVLVAMIFTMLIMGVMALAMNREAGMRARMVSNRARSIQIHFGQLAAIEDARWQLTRDSAWRTAAGGADYEYDGITYNRKALDCTIAGYEDAVTVSITAPGGLDPMRVHLKWQLVGPTPVSKLYISDPWNHRIRMVDMETGIITTVAGTGTDDYNGDDQPATDAMLKEPFSVYVDTDGNMYIGDSGNHRVRKVDGETGIITTFAGTGTGDYNGDDQPATSAQLNRPRAVYGDANGNIYIADFDNSRIRKVDGATGMITTVAGTGTAGYNGDDQPATSAQLTRPDGVFVDASENIYISDSENHRIRRVDGETGTITTVAGTGTRGYNGE